MLKIAIYGKGGSGKSTISAALSVILARRGMKVLHVGCDPKADSTLTLTGGRRIPTLLDLLAAGDRRPTPDRFVFPGRHGIDCIEAGGPRPGAGCGGRGVARMFELFQEVRLLQIRPYDVVVFDVLGDVVCGGFAAPLRLGFADLAFIVVSEEPLSLYAANNIIHAIRSYRANGVRLGGFILNVSDERSGESLVETLAERVGTQVVGIIPRDRDIQLAERRNLTAAELDPASPTVAALERLADSILASSTPDAGPTPLSPEDLFALLASGADEPPGTSVQPMVGEAGWASGPVVSVVNSGSRGAGIPSTAVVAAGISSAAVIGAGGPQTAAEGVGSQEPAFRGRTVVGSQATRKAFSQLLVLDRDPFARLLFDVTSVQARRGILFVVLDSPSSGRLELQLSNRKDQAYARVRDIAVTHSDPLPKAGRKVLDYCIRRIERASVTFPDLCRWLGQDPGAEWVATEEETRESRLREAVPQARHWNQWTRDSIAGVFFFPQERRRQVLAEVHISDPVVVVQHGTQACGVSEQATTGYSSHFVRYPWCEERSGRESVAGASYYLTDIQEHEIISGSNEALEGALRTLHEAHPDSAVVIEVSCTPVISGEDWNGAITRFREVHKAPILVAAMAGDDLNLELARAGLKLLDTAPASDVRGVATESLAASAVGGQLGTAPGSHIRGVATESLAASAVGGQLDTGQETRRPVAAAAEGRVHLVGFPRIRATQELVRLLSACGIEVVQQQVPNISLRGLGGFSSEASAQLLWPQAEFEPLYEELFLHARVPAVRIVPPFGLSGTRAFLEQAARGAGLDPVRALDGVEPELQAMALELAQLADRARSVRLGIAVTPHFSPMPESPGMACGVPLLAFLSELGFQVEILQDAQERARLDWWLRSGLAAVFTELAFDERLAAAGVAPFGLPDLEPGPAGAVRTAERLLRLAGLRFFSDFGRHAGREATP